jgi:hypothetical protein
MKTALEPKLSVIEGALELRLVAKRRLGAACQKSNHLCRYRGTGSVTRIETKASMADHGLQKSG